MEMTTFRPSKPHFFKPVLPGSLQETSIPKAFFREYLLGEKCGGRATLRTNRSSSKSWSVKIRGLCFKEGWEEFVRAHDLCVGEVLVFRHEGGFKFHVIVFDYTACEKQYPQIQENEQKMAQAKAGEKKVNKEFAKKKTTLQIRDGCPVNRRMCSHCRTDSTPGWRIGPMGRNTLCNACGIRYRQGKLAPEYRPI